MADRNLEDCCLELQKFIPTWSALCNKEGITVRPIVTWRGKDDQNTAKANGLSNASFGESPHNHVDENGNPCSLAIDFGIFDGGTYVQNGKDDRYRRAGKVAESLGLSWGGRWTHPDFDHIELENWETYGLEVA